MMRLLLLTVLIFCLGLWASQKAAAQCASVQGLDLYWVGINGSGDFNNPSHWRVGSFSSIQEPCQAPRSGDNVYFPASAFSSPGAVIQIVNNSSCDKFNFDPAITWVNRPILRCTNSSINLDIFGDFDLGGSLIWQFQGNLRFRSVRAASTVHTIATRGVRLLVNSMVIDPSGMVEYQLQDSLWVDDPSGGPSNDLGGVLVLNAGYLNSNSKVMRLDAFHSTNNNVNRRLNISGSRVLLNRRESGNCWNVDFNRTIPVPNFTNFQAQGSHLVIEAPNPSFMNLGRGLRYDSITFGRRYDLPNTPGFNLLTLVQIASRDTFHYMNLYRRVGFSGGVDLVVEQVHLEAEAQLGAANGTVQFGVDSVITYVNCHTFPTIGPSSMTTRASGWGWSGQINLRKLSPGVLTIQQALIGNVTGDQSGGRSYLAYHCGNKGSNNNLNFVSRPTRAMYFRRSTNSNWSNLGNWQEWTGSGFVAATCLPSPFDDVYFDGQSFLTGTQVTIDSQSHCRSMRWLNVPNNVVIRTQHLLYVFGTLQWAPNMGASSFTTSDAALHMVMLCSPNLDSVISQGAVNPNIRVGLDVGVDYRIVGNYTGTLWAGNRSRIRMEADTLRVQGTWLFAFANFNGTQIYVHAGINHEANYGMAVYSGAATLHFLPPISGSFQSCRLYDLPNTIFYPGSNYYLWPTLRIYGNLTLLHDATLGVGFLPEGRTASLDIFGGLNGAPGNLNVNPGARILFANNAAGLRALINGSMNVVGDCNKMASMQTINGQALTGGLTVLGAVNVQNAYLQGMRNVSTGANANLTALNSVDGGNNPGWTFTAGASQTFYWRAKRGNPTLFVGNWSDPGHWTIDSTRNVGDSACTPTGFDDVVFDALSFSPTSNGCTVSTAVFCRDISIRAGARLVIGNTALSCRNLDITASNALLNGNIGQAQLNIRGSLTLTHNMNMPYRGDIIFSGSGDIRTNGTRFRAAAFIFDNPAGIWHLRDALNLTNDSTSLAADHRAGELRLLAGQLFTNNFPVSIASYFNSTTTANRALHLGTSVLTHQARAGYHIAGQTPWLWNVNATNFVLTFSPGARIDFRPSSLFGVSSNTLEYRFGNGLSYPPVRIEDPDNPVAIFGNTNHQFLQLQCNAYVDGNNNLDSIRLDGGYFYRFRANSIQTLLPPHGKIISNGTNAAFVNIESATAGLPFNLRKPYGPSFCIDYAKVKDCVGTKQTDTTLIPINYRAIQPFLEFQTGVNCDNVGGTATGIWAFNLPLLLNLTYSGPAIIQPCRYGDATGSTWNLPITGTGPYQISYTWVGSSGATGNTTSILADNDADPFTPFPFAVPISSNDPSITYTFQVSTLRCGELVGSINPTIRLTQLNPQLLTQTPQTFQCTFNNESSWYTMIGSADNRPVLSLLDQINPSDNQALGLVNAQVFFDPTVQYYNDGFQNYPYLQRHWQIRPSNNGPARVRLYFTQAELNALGLANLYNPNLNPAIDIQVRSFSGNGVGIGTMSIIPHTVVPLVGSNALPFSSTAQIIAVEFEVSSFSHFIITPTINAILPLQLLHFEAQKTQNLQVHTHWQVAQEQELSYYEVQRSQNFQQIQSLGNVQAQNQALTSYQFTDPRPLPGLSYYRLRSVDKNGLSLYSNWVAVELPGAQPLAIFPNPTKRQLNVRMLSTQTEFAHLYLYDGLGRLVWSQNFELSPGYSILDCQFGELSPGLYQLNIQTTQTEAQFTQPIRIE